ncbi:MAG: hypothetical protein HZA32_08510 [Opitutae bacterium]|nr:hypothetical protein [Opitutae bacterium]
MSLKADIEAAFPKLNPDSAGFFPDEASDDEMRQLAGDISSFYIDDVPPFLGALLYWSARNPPNEAWSLERLIYYLNANLEAPFFAGVGMGRGADEVENERRQRMERQREFERLTPAQITAVRDWLAEAQTWPSMKPLAHEVADARGYWNQLAARVRLSK